MLYLALLVILEFGECIGWLHELLVVSLSNIFLQIPFVHRIVIERTQHDVENMYIGSVES